MKKQFLGLLTLIIISFSSVAQEARPQMLTVEERTKATMEKLAPLQLSDSAKPKVDLVFTDFYTEQQKAMEEMRASGNMEALRNKRQELSQARDEKLKLLLTADQLKKWLEEIEPGIRPQRRSNKN